MHDRIRQLVATVLGLPPDTIADDTSFQELAGWDSVMQLHILLAMEEELHMTLDPYQGALLQTVNDLARYVQEHRAAGGA